MMSRLNKKLFFLLCLFLILVVSASLAIAQDDDSSDGDDTGDDTPPPSIEVVDLPDGTLIDDPSIIDGWRQDGDIDAIRAHGWGIWAGLNSPSGQFYKDLELPVWETWFTGPDVYERGPEVADFSSLRGHPREAEPARQQTDVGVGGATLPEGESAIMSFIKLNRASADHVWINDYWTVTGLDTALKNCDPNDPVDSCSIQPFPNDAVNLKPTLWPIAQDAVSLIPVWNGIFPGESTSWIGASTTAPSSSTWMQCVAVDLTGANQPGDMIDVTCNGTDTQAEVVALDDFFHFVVDEDEYADFNSDGQPFDQEITLADGTTRAFDAGDSLALVAMHVTTREIDQWTWQTFWWSPDPDDPTPVIWPPQYDSIEAVIEADEMYVNYPGTGADRPDTIEAPFDNYVMCTNYMFVYPAQPLVGGTTVDTKPEFCFNPYLEAGFARTDFSFGGFSNAGGINTNCMACHGNATWGGIQVSPSVTSDSLDYTAADYISRDDPQFATNPNPAFSGVYLQLDFAWNVTRAGEGILEAIFAGAGN